MQGLGIEHRSFSFRSSRSTTWAKRQVEWILYFGYLNHKDILSYKVHARRKRMASEVQKLSAWTDRWDIVRT